MSKIYIAWKSFFLFMKRKNTENSVVFYSQGNSYKPFLFPLIEEILHKYNLNIYYLTSDINDSILLFKNINFTPYYIGNGLALTLSFYFLKARIMVMTMPDLNLFHLKRNV